VRKKVTARRRPDKRMSSPKRGGEEFFGEESRARIKKTP